MASLGWTCRRSPEQTRAGLLEVLGERGSASNPADITGYANSPSFEPILSTLLADPGMDAWVIATQGGDDLVGKIVGAAASTPKPITVVWTGGLAKTGRSADAPGQPSVGLALPTGGARGLAALVSLAEARRTPRARDEEAATPASPGLLSGERATLVGILSEHQSKRLLAEAGIQSPPETLGQSADETVSAAVRSATRSC